MFVLNIFFCILICRLPGSHAIPLKELTGKELPNVINVNDPVPDATSDFSPLNFNENEEENTEKGLPSKCPNNTFPFTASDINYMIDSFIDEMEIDETHLALHLSYFNEAIAIIVSMQQQFTNFTNSFLDRPEGLKQIHEHNRQSIETKLSGVIDALNKFPDFESQYNKYSQKYARLLEEINYHKMLCQNYCNNIYYGYNYDYVNYYDYDYNRQYRNEYILSKATTYSSTSQSYCSTYQDIKKTISKKLQLFINDTSEYLKNKLQMDQDTYNHKLDSFKQKLKNLALQKYSQSMYYILNIEEEYIHLPEIEMELDSALLESMLLAIHRDLEELESFINIYGQDCGCSYFGEYGLRNRIRRMDTSHNVNEDVKEDNTEQDSDYVEENNTEKEIDNLIGNDAEYISEVLTDVRLAEIRNRIDSDYLNMSKYIRFLFDNENIIEFYTSQLQKVLPSIDAIIQKDNSFIEELKLKVSPKFMSDFKTLLDAVKVLENEISILSINIYRL